MRCGLALSCVAWWASVAAAQPAERAPSGKQAIAILSLEIAGGSSDRLRGQVAEAVERAVAAAGARYIPAEATASALDGAPELRGCLSASCLGRLSELTGAGRFIRAHVSVSGDSYVLDLELLSPGAEGGLAGRLQRTCSVCTVTDLRDRVTGAASELLAGVSDPDGVAVEITCRPDGAEIVIDEEVRGQAPFRGRLPPGPHVVVARLDGYAESRKTIVVETTGEQRFEIGLTATAALTVDQRPHPALKWVAAGGAAAALVTGVVLLAMDGRGTCDADGDACQEVYDTRTAGLVGVAVGLAAGGAAGWLFARDR
ncbi:MAG TPA: PEGA domain-containing protein [Kofleriaceae bacterium]|nr:PEGA domain-containing protein [Kofleriaceae bacterium]